MLSETELKMLTKIGFIVAGAIFIITGMIYHNRPDSTPLVNISIGIALICVGIAQS
jgi:uncharacterized membrane protein HdeD (DUF308 family)